MPGDDLAVLLKKLVQALGEEWHCHDGEWQLVATILRHFGGTPSQGDTIPVLWQKIRIAIGDEACHCGDWEWDSIRRVIDQFLTDSFRAGDSLYNLVLKFLTEVNGGVNPPVLDPPVITQTGFNELSVSGLYFGSGGTTLYVESSPNGISGWVVMATVAINSDPELVDISGEINEFFRARVDVSGTFTPYSAVVEVYRPPTAFGNFPNDDMEGYNHGDLLEGLNGGENGNNGFTIQWTSDYSVLPYGAVSDPITPDDSSLVANLRQWVKADAILGLSDGDPLATWEDQSINNLDFTASGAERPTYNTNVQNGLPAVNLTSTSGVGMHGTVGISTGDMSIMVAFKSNSVADVTGRRVVQGSANWLLGPYAGYVRSYNGAFLQAYYPSITPMVMIVTQSGTADFRGYLNGTLFGRRTSGIVYPGTINLGAIGGFNEPANCRIFEFAVYDRVLTEAEAYGLSLSMVNKWAL